MKAVAIKALTGAKTRTEGESLLYKRLESLNWELNGREAKMAGYDRKKDLLHFTSTWSIEGGCGHRRVGISLETAVKMNGGSLSLYDYTILC